MSPDADRDLACPQAPDPTDARSTHRSEQAQSRAATIELRSWLEQKVDGARRVGLMAARLALHEGVDRKPEAFR